MKQRFALNTLVVLIVAVCLVACNVTAQTPYLKAGTKALQFQIQNDFLLRSFDGSTISLKKQTASDRAYRMGLSLSANASDRDEERIDPFDANSGYDEDRNSQDIQLSIQKLFYSNPAGRTYAYFGLGPTGRFARSHRDRSTTNTNGNTTMEESLSRTWSVGIVGSLGVEWFANRSISLMAEYNTTAAIGWQKDKVESTPITGTTSTRELNQTSYSISDNGVRFGLAVYF